MSADLDLARAYIHHDLREALAHATGALYAYLNGVAPSDREADQLRAAIQKFMSRPMPVEDWAAFERQQRRIAGLDPAEKDQLVTAAIADATVIRELAALVANAGRGREGRR